MTDLPEDVNQEILDVLDTISKMAWAFHNNEKPYDPNLCLTLGTIAGICDKAIEEYKGKTNE